MSRTASISGQVFQLGAEEDGQIRTRMLGGTKLEAYAVDTRNGEKVLIGRTIADSDGNYTLQVHHESSENSREALERWWLSIEANYQGTTWKDSTTGMVYAMPPVIEGQQVIYNFGGDVPPIIVVKRQLWHEIAQRLADDCGISLAEVQLDFDIDRPFTEFSPAQQRTLAGILFQNRITSESDIDRFLAHLVEVLSPGTSPAEVAKDKAAELAIKEVLGCCDVCGTKTPIVLPPWDISLPKLPQAALDMLSYNGLQLFLFGRTINGRMYTP
jgi:hypothetical protein